MENIYMEIVLGHASFSCGKICVVALSSYMQCELISSYVGPAKRKAYKELGLCEDDVKVLDWSYLGNDIVFC